jgi:hypothetical protein
MTVLTTENEAQLFQWGIIIFWPKPSASWCICLFFAQFCNCHKQQHHLTALLISLCIIPNHRVDVLTHCDQRVDSCWNCAVYNLHRQVNLRCTLGTRLHMSVQPLSEAGDIQYVCQLQYFLLLSSTSKLLATHISLTLHVCYTML